jgi:hypothetical protein
MEVGSRLHTLDNFVPDTRLIGSRVGPYVGVKTMVAREKSLSLEGREPRQSIAYPVTFLNFISINIHKNVSNKSLEPW